MDNEDDVFTQGEKGNSITCNIVCLFIIVSFIISIIVQVGAIIKVVISWKI